LYDAVVRVIIPECEIWVLFVFHQVFVKLMKTLDGVVGVRHRLVAKINVIIAGNLSLGRETQGEKHQEEDGRNGYWRKAPTKAV
jgi:hypothetical protein